MKPVIVFRHAPHVPLGSLEHVLAEAGVPQETVDLFAGVPDALSLDAAAGLVILGGPVETVFQWHGDTFDLPDGAVPLARGLSCPNQAFRVGPAAYGVQFHVEMTPRLIDEWLEEPGFSAEVASLDYIDPKAIRDRAPERIVAMDSFSQCLLGRFAAWCNLPRVNTAQLQRKITPGSVERRGRG